MIGRTLLGLIPAPVWLALAGVLAALAISWHLRAVHAARNAGRAEVQAERVADDLARERAANADRVRNVERAATASTAHETARAALAASLRENQNALQQALRAPLACAGGTVGDVVVPGAALDRLRDAAGAGAGTDRPAAGQPRRPVRSGAADTRRQHPAGGRAGRVASTRGRRSGMPRPASANRRSVAEVIA